MYLEAIWDELFLYKSYYRGIAFKSYLLINVKINAKGKFIGTIIGYQSNNEQLEIRDAIIDIVNNKIRYKPAFYNNKPVEIFNDFSLQMKRLN